MAAPQALTLSEAGALLAVSLLASALCFILPHILGLLIKIALSKADVVDRSVSVSATLGLKPVLRLRLRGVLLSDKLLHIINRGWGAALPLVMTRAAVEQLSLELDLAELILEKRLPCVVLDGVEVQAHITHQEDWSVQAEVLRWIERKHAMANYLTKILSGEKEEPRVTAVATAIDWIINNARLMLQNVHLRIEDPKHSHAMGLQLTELSISPEAPSEESLWEVPRAVVMRDFAFYVDLHGLNVAAGPGADHHYMLRFSKVEVCIEFPDILGVLVQPGTMPFGRGKRMRIFGDFYHARPLVHQLQMPTFLFEMLKAFGPFEYLPWKSQVAKQLENSAAQSLETVDVDVYLSLCAAKEPTTEQLAKMKAIEARLPLSEIMSLRRQAYGWTFEVPSLDAPRDPLLQYSTGRFEDDAMSAKLAALRPMWDSERYSLRELYYAPLRFHDFNAKLAAFVPGTSDSLLHNTLCVEHMEAFCRILLARNEKGVTTGAAGAGEPAVKFLETGGSLRRVVLRDERGHTDSMPSSCLLQPSIHNGSQGVLDDIEHISGSYKLDSNWNQFIEGEVNGCTIAGGALREILDMVWVIVASFRRGDLGGSVHAPTIDVEKLWAIPSAELLQTLADSRLHLEADGEAALTEAPTTHVSTPSNAASAAGPSNSLLLQGLKMVIDASLVDVDVVVFPGTEYQDSQLQLLQVAGRFLLDSKSLQELMAVQLDKLILRPATLQHLLWLQLPLRTTQQVQQAQQQQRWNMHVQKRMLLSCKSISATYASSVSCTEPHEAGHAPHRGQRHERPRFVERRVCVAVDYGSFIDIPDTIDGMAGLRHPSLVIRVGKQERWIESINRDTLAPQFAQQLDFYVLCTGDFATSPTQGHAPLPKGVQVELYDNKTANGGEPSLPFIRSPGAGPTYLGSGTLPLAPESLNCWQRVSIVSAAGVTLGDLLMKADMTDPMFAVEIQSISRLRPQLQRRYSDSTMTASDIHIQPRMYLTVSTATTSPSTELRSRRAARAPSVVGVMKTRAKPFTQRTKPFPPREAVSLSEVFYFPATPDSDYLLEFRLVAQDNRSTEEVACAELVFRSAEPLAVPLALCDSRGHVVAEISVSVDWSRSGKAPSVRLSARAADPHDPRDMHQQIAELTQVATRPILPPATTSDELPSRHTQRQSHDDESDDDDISVHSELSISGFEGGREYRANSLDWMDAFFDDTKQEHFTSPVAAPDRTTIRRHANLHARTFDLELLEQDVSFALASARAILSALRPAPQPTNNDDATAAEQPRPATVSLEQGRVEADKAAFAAVLQELLQAQQLTRDSVVNKQVARTLLGELKRHGNLTAPEWAELKAELMQELDKCERLPMSEFVDWLLALARQIQAGDADGITTGRVVPVCQELCSPIWWTTLLESHASVRHAIASSDGHVFVDRVWENLGQLLEDVSAHAPPRIGARLFQAKLVRALKHYSLARDVWRYIIVPTYLQLPFGFDISAGNGMQCLAMVPPVMVGTKVFLDYDCAITSLPPLLHDRPLAGICTYKAPRQGSKPTLEFTLSRAALVYVCMDCHCGLPSNWFAAEGFTRIDGTVGTSDGNYSLFGKLYEVAGRVRLGKRFNAHGQRCSYFLLLQTVMDMAEAQALASANFDSRWQLQGNWSLAKSVVSDGLRVAGEETASVAETKVVQPSSVRQCILVGGDIGGFTVRLLDPVQRIALVQLTLDVLSTQLMLARVAQADTPFLLSYDDVAKGHLDLAMRGTCYNQLLAAHEPFLEPWDARLQLSKSANSTATFCSIDTSRRLAINVTAQLHQTLHHTVSILRRWKDNAFAAPTVAATTIIAEQGASARSRHPELFEEPWSSVVFRNGVGEPVRVQLSNASHASDGSQTLLVLPDEAVTIRCVPDGAAPTPPRWLLSVRLPATGVDPLKDVLVGEVGERMYPVRIADMLQSINEKPGARSEHGNSIAQYGEFYASSLDRLQLLSGGEAEIEPLALVLETRLLPRFTDGRLIESHEAATAASDAVAETESTVAGGNALELFLRTNVCIENRTTTPIDFRTALVELEAPQRLAVGDTLPMPLYQLLRQRIQFTRLGLSQAPESLQLSLGVLNPLLAPGLRRPKDFIEKSVAVKVTSTREALSTTQTSGFELETGEQADTADIPSADAAETANVESHPAAVKRASKSRLGALFSRSKRSVAPIAVPTADWSLVFLPAYEIVNALPCSVTIHVDQPPRPTRLRRETSRKQDGARDLFFLPDQFYVRDGNGDPIIAALDEADDGDWVPFHTEVCRVTHVPPGATVPLDAVDLDRTMAVRVSIPGTDLISEDIMIAAHVHNARLAFQKHRPQLLRWQFADQISLAARRGAPQLRVKREWTQQGTRALLLYSSIWIVNKTGMSLWYKSFVKQSTRLPNAITDVEEKVGQRAEPSALASTIQPLKRKLLTDCTTADSFYQQVFGEQAGDAVPVMLDCPAKKLAVLPYAMASDRNPLYLYELRVKSPLPYRCHDRLEAGALLRMDGDVVLEVLPGCCADRRTIYIQTPSVDPAAHTTEEPFMTFMLPVNAFVYIGLPNGNSHAEPLPWMVAEGYRLVQGETVRASSSSSSATSTRAHDFRLFSKFYTAGSRVALGGTASSLLESTGLTVSPPQLYVIFVSEAHDSEAEPTATDLQTHRDITDSVLCRARYAWHPRFLAGSKPYVDRDYRINALPHPLDKMALLGLQTAQGDKWSTADRLVTFHLEQASEVLVCLDGRSRHPPLWLKSVGFVKLGLTIPGATEGYHYDVYSKSYDGGLVVLGGNGRAGGKRNYFVLIAALEEFLQWMPRADGIHHAHHHTLEGTVLQTMADGKSVHRVWDTDAEGELLHIRPPFAALGRRWSPMIDVKSRNVGELVTPCGVFGVKVTPLSGLLHRTAMVTLLPRFIVVNQLGFAVRIFPRTLSTVVDGAAVEGIVRSGDLVASRQPSREKAFKAVPAGASCVLYDFALAFPDTQTSDGGSSNSPRRVVILQQSSPTGTLEADDGPPLSQPVFVEEVGQQFVWLVGSNGASSSGNDAVVVSATMTVENPIVYILLQDVTASPPYRLENRSPTTALLFKPDPSAHEWKVLPPLSWRSFVIESPWADRELLVAAEGFEQQPRRIVLDSVGQTEHLVWQASAGLRNLIANLVSGGQQPTLADVCLAVRVVVDNRTRVVQFYDVAPTLPSVRYLRGASFLESLCTELRIVGVDVSLVDSGQGSSMELLSCSIEGIFVRMDGAKRSLDVSVYHVQVDDHRPQARFPVVLGPLDSGFNSHLRDEKQEVPMLRFRARGHDNAAGYLHLAELEMVMQELVLKLDMQYILQLVAFLGKFTADLESARGVEDVVLTSAAEKMLYRASRPAEVGAETFVFLEVFHHSSLLVHTEIYVGQRVIDLDPSKLEGSIAHGFLLLGAPVMSSVSAVLSSVAHTSPSFVFKELVVENFFGEPSRLAKALQLSLTQQAIAQSYKLFGSMEVLGDPLSLVGNLGTGVVEFFRRTGAEMIGDADTRGAGVRKLLKGVVGGTFNSASKISGSLADIVQGVGGNAPLERRFSSRPVDLQSGLRQGGEVFVDSLRSGFKGVVAEPRRGLEEGGMAGAVGGVFRGVLGLATAPIVGSLGAVARFTEGVDALAKFYHGRPMGRRRAAKRLDAKRGTILPPLKGVWEQNLPARFRPDGDGPLPLLVPAFVPCGTRQWMRLAVSEEVQMLNEDLSEDHHSRRKSSTSSTSSDEDVEDVDGNYEFEQARADRP